MSLNFINKINISHLKIFESVYRLKSMTLAAQELHLTQSGVSQHMSKLEKSLDVVLFVRNQKKLFPTDAGQILYKTCLESFQNLEGALTQIKDPQGQQLSGTIRIGMPTEFGNNIAIPFLAEWGKKNKGVKFDFVYGYGLSLLQQLEKQEIDLAFIDSIPKSKKVESRVIFQETLNLVATKDYLKGVEFSVENYQNLLKLDYIEYERKENIIRNWFQYNYKKKNVAINVRAWVMSVQGVANLVRQGFGAAIVPHHLLEKLHKQGVSLHIFKGKKAVMTNDISIAWVSDIPQSQAAMELIKHVMNKNTIKGDLK